MWKFKVSLLKGERFTERFSRSREKPGALKINSSGEKLRLKKNSAILNGLNHSYPLTGAEPETFPLLRSESIRIKCNTLGLSVFFFSLCTLRLEWYPAVSRFASTLKKLTLIGLTQNISQTLISPCPLRLYGSLFRNSCVSPI
jgi:hypothetical protein